MYLFYVNVSIKTIDKNSNKEFVKQACLSFYVYCNVIGMEGTFPLACPLVQYIPPFVFVCMANESIL